MRKISFYILYTVIILLSACNGNDKKISEQKPDSIQKMSRLPDSIETFSTYFNARYGFSVKYPHDLVPRPESENGDGRIFVEQGGREVMRAYAIQDIDKEGIEAYHKSALELASNVFPSWRILSSNVGKDYCEFEGTTKDLLYFRRTIFRDGLFISASCQTDSVKSKTFEQLKNLIRRTLKKDGKGWQ